MRRLLVMLTVSMCMMGLTGPASAAIRESYRGSFDYDFTEEDLCDFDVEVAGVRRYNFQVREGKNSREQAFFVRNTFQINETLSANDRSVTFSERRTFNEVQAMPLGDGVFQFSDVFAGRIAVRDARGRVLAHEAGVIRTTYTFDTLSDDEPGGNVIGEVEETVRGRFGDDIDAAICAALAPSEG
jgi:hypothetical protein